MTKEHVSKLVEEKDYHQAGEENGCVTRCIWKAVSEKTPWLRKCMVPGHDHRENGRNYSISLVTIKSWYDLDFFSPGPARERLEEQVSKRAIFFRGLKKDPRKLAERMAWNLETSDNFKNSKKPWRNNAHHIIPVGSLHNFFTYEELRILQKGKYNINRGVNIALLPQQECYGQIYMLPTHPRGSHANYNALVDTQLDAIKDKFERERNQKSEQHPRLTDENVENWGKDLEAFSKRMRLILRRLARATPLSKSLAIRDIKNMI